MRSSKPLSGTIVIDMTSIIDIDIDRTLFDVRYGSTKFFDNIADRAINDIFTVDYELYLEKK